MDLIKNGDLIRNLRKAKGMTQKQVAEKLYEYPAFLSGYQYEYHGQEEPMRITDIFRTP